MHDIVTFLNGIIWSRGLIYVCLGVGLYFSLRTRFVQVRGIGEMLRLMLSNRPSTAGVSSFRALAMSLSGRIGIGNIAGVATAIGAGGPGAVFWMWTVAFLGASTAYIESTLGQIYKEKDDGGRYRGGPAYYIEKAMGQRWYAWIFAFTTVIATGALLPGVQANGIAVGVQNAWGLSTTITAAVLAIALAIIIVGGVTRIAKFAEIVVPFMAFGYILMAVVILIAHAGEIPALLTLIVKSAFGLEAAYGGMLGLAVEWGVRRGVYSNEAGQGTGPHAAAAAEVSHPAEQGYVQAFSIYVDTLLVCSATAFMILATGAYNVYRPDGSAIVSGLPGAETGPAFTQAAVDYAIPGFGASFVAIALMFFAFTTIVAYYYMAETNIQYMTRTLHRPWTLHALKVVMLVSVAWGAIRTADTAWALGDLGVGLMAWLNIVAILILQKPALIALRDYERQKRAGLRPAFNPDTLGIAHADLWREIASEDTRTLASR